MHLSSGLQGAACDNPDDATSLDTELSRALGGQQQHPDRVCCFLFGFVLCSGGICPGRDLSG